MNTPASDAAAVRQIIRLLRDHGATITRIVTGDETIDVPARADEATILSYLMETGAEILTAVKGSDTTSITFVYGNSPREVVWEVQGSEESVLTLAVEELVESWLLMAMMEGAMG